jgi:hypothetical protein
MPYNEVKFEGGKVIMKIPRSTKGKLKGMRDSIVEQMSNEQDLQAELRLTIVTSEDEYEVTNAKMLFDESVEHWEVLKRSLEEYDKFSKSNWKFTPDTLLVVGGNLLGIVLILNFERLDIVRSKALGFVLKGRV